MSNKITNIYAREILDSRGNPTLEVTVEAGKIITKAKVPSGASTGSYEAHELRDNDEDRYGGKGVLRAAQNVNQKIKAALLGLEVDQLSQLDQRMIELDGTPNKARLGGNAILGCSLALARAGAWVNNLPLYKFIRQFYFPASRGAGQLLAGFKLPVPLVNVINGGKHADSGLDFQEFWIIPQNLRLFKEKVRAMAEIFHQLGKILQQGGYDIGLGDEGGYAFKAKSYSEVWQFMLKAIQQAGYQAGAEIFLGLDAASSSFYNPQEGKYEIKLNGEKLSSGELAILYQKWLAQYPLLAFEDPFAEDDWRSWENFSLQLKSINQNILVIGDDLFTTNIARLEQGIKSGAANAILIKPNQIGTLTETVNCLKLALEHRFKVVISHRSGETEDDFIADLAVAVNADYIKTGAPSRSERVVKYNRLMEIEEELEH